jgi:hypothetical protein
MVMHTFQCFDCQAPVFAVFSDEGDGDDDDDKQR